MDIPGLAIDERRHSRVLEQPLAAPRGGILLHYDDSSRDDWAVEWFSDPRCTNGYTWLVLDDGRVVQLADPAYRTPHAGACKTPNANSHYYGLAAATNGLVPATDRQLASIDRVCVAVCRYHGWTPESIAQRITGHDAQAIWTRATTADQTRWGKTGRKVDPTGVRHDGRPIIDVAAVVERVMSKLSMTLHSPQTTEIHT